VSPEAFNAWARTWADEAVPALEGTTPRLTAQDAPGRILLEAQLRDFEHRAAVNRARGLGHVDVAEFRSVLGVSAGARPKLGADRPI
jgi:hypothetical protein